MAFCDVNFFGPSIGKSGGMYVILPEGDGPFPVLYLLHGLSDDHTIWHRRTSLERYLAGVPLIVAMPDGHRSFYCNDRRPGGLNYEDYIYKDVVGFVDRTFRTIPRRQSRAVAGLSMGGYGATMLAMRHPDVFSAACSHSGAVGFTHRSYKHLTDADCIASALPRGQYDCFALARKIMRGGQKVAYRLDCGLDDHLIADNRAFHAHLDKIGYRHEYAEHPGQHNWDYWDAHIRQTIEFVMKNMKR